jgi:hypothetical protein
VQPRSTQVPKNALPAFTRQHQVEDNRVIDSMFCKVGSAVAIGGSIYGEPRLTQSRNDVFRQPLLVFNQEYTHSKRQ